MWDKLGEECGVFGIAAAPDTDLDVALETYQALYALQHRGQQSCGIAVSRGSEILVKKGDGLVPENFDDRALLRLRGRMAMGHVRYSSSSGGAGGVNAQPIVVHHLGGHMAVAVNGTLVNAQQLRTETELRGGIFQTSGDAELISYLIVRESLKTERIEDALMGVMQYMEGAYSLLVMSGRKLIAARDPRGFRPLCMGELNGSPVFASESCALDAIGAHFTRDIEPGEIVVAEGGQVRSLKLPQKVKTSLCVFEYVYFARPDSVLDGQSVELSRQEAGRCLARRSTTEADVVIGVPDSGLSAALGFAQESGIPYAVGLVKNRYIGRTFIQPSQGQRERAVGIKLNPLSAVVSGKRVIMVDDSIVRGTTCSRIVSLLRGAGATEVHMKVSSPPFLHPCYFGTDIPSREALIAHNRSVDEITGIIGADSLQYMALEDLPMPVKDLRLDFCNACFTGRYPVPVGGETQDTAGYTEE